MEILIADSTAIAFLNENELVTGEGDCLRVYNTSKFTTLWNSILNVKIHGIVVGDAANGKLLLVYGERHFNLLADNFQTSFYKAEITDCISTACFLSQSTEFVLLTAHSVLLRYRKISGKWQLATRYSCTDKSTLYCAHLHGTTFDNLVVFAGNAFGELLIWQPSRVDHKSDEKKPLTIDLLQRLTAHNGVIFSIDYDEETRLLITTSDDRSIRFWRISELINNDWNQMKCTAISTGFAHTARVFCGKFISYDEEKYAVTVGEDSFVCIWHTNGVLIHKCRQQFGATIWNFVYCKQTKTLYTIGSTSNVLPLNLSAILDKTQTSSYLLPSLLDASEYVAKVKFINEFMLVGVTNKNTLVYYELNTSAACWQTVNALENFKCTVLEVFEKYIILAGFKRLIIFKLDSEFIKTVDISILSSVIRSVQILAGKHALVSDDLGNCCFLENLFSQPTNFRTLEIDLPKCKERFITASLLISNEFLLASNRQGNLLLYARKSEHKFELVDTYKHAHGNLGSTALQLLQNTADKAFVCSAGRDGATCLFCIEKNTSKLKFYSRKRVAVTWVEYIVALQENVFFGFNDNHFVAWSSERDFLAEIPCGGGHRCWHFYLHNQQDLQLAFIQNRRVHYEKLNLYAKFQTHLNLDLRNKWHIKACNIAAGDAQLFVSAGEDNLIKIFDLRVFKFVESLEIDTHISNVRALKLIRPTQQSILLFSGGGRAQLCVHEVDLSLKTVKVCLDYTIKNETNLKQQQELYSFDPETRIMALDAVKLLNNWCIFMGCSDGYLRKLTIDGDTFEVKQLSQLFLQRCVLQTRLIDNRVLLAATTDGLLRFYDLDLKRELRTALTHHASGINALDIAVINNSVHLLSGGDDQSVTYSCVKIDDLSVVRSYTLPFLHTAQVTAVGIEANGVYAHSCGVDQQLFKLHLETGKVMAMQKIYVADVKGLCLWPEETQCVVYGCGVQVSSINYMQRSVSDALTTIRHDINT